MFTKVYNKLFLVCQYL